MKGAASRGKSMQRPRGNWSVKCTLWQVLVRGSSLGWAEHAIVIAGTRRRWSGRQSPRPTIQSPVENVAAWDPDTHARDCPHRSHEDSDPEAEQEEERPLQGPTGEQAGQEQGQGPHTHKSKRTPCLWIYPAAREASRLSPSGRERNGSAAGHAWPGEQNGLAGTSDLPFQNQP